MESRSFPFVKLQQFKKETYVHRISLPESKSKFDAIQKELATTIRDEDDDPQIIISFSFELGEILSTVKHSFRFNLSKTVHGLYEFQEDISASKEAQKKQVSVSSVMLAFCSGGQVISTHKSTANCEDIDLHYTKYVDWEWGNLGKFWTESVDEIKISVIIVKGWDNPHVSGQCSFLPSPTVNQFTFQDSAKYYLSAEASNVVIVCGDSKIPAHRFVLCRSPVFEKMLQVEYKEGNNCVIEIVDIEESVMKLFLQFLYCGQVEEIDKIAIVLLPVANKYLVEELKFACEYQLAEQLNRHNVIDMYRFSEMFNSENLKEICKIMFKTYKTQIVTTTESFKQLTAEFPELMFHAYSTDST